MSYIDLHETMLDWPYDADQISVRKVLGVDGNVRLQLRVELGILQMEPTGRPDGARPFGCDSLLEYHKLRLEQHETANGTPLGFALSLQECQELRVEASLFYRRYVALFVLEEYANVVSDASHTLAVMELFEEHAAEPTDRTSLESFRPYVVMMIARAQAYSALEHDEPASALAHANRGILQLEQAFDETGELEMVERSEEMKMLRHLVVEVTRQMPRNSLVAKRNALRTALDEEKFEEAARLRDELKKLQTPDRATDESLL